MPGMPNDAVPTTALAGGSVVIHTGTTYDTGNDPLQQQPSRPVAFAFHGVSPSPFRDAARVRFDLPHTSRVRLTVYDVAGREVARLVDAVLEPGQHERLWDGSGRVGGVDPGVYFVRLEARAVSVPGGLDAVRKVVRVR